MDIQHLAAESSALKNTLAQAEDSVENPFDYAIEKQMPSNAVQWLSHTPVGTNSISAASSIQFELQRYGFLRGCVFECDVSVAALADHSGTNGYDDVANVMNLFPRLIDEVEFHSSSRRLARLSGKNYYAILKNMKNDGARNMLETNLLCDNDEQFAVSETGATTLKFRLPLLFSYFENVATSVDSSFVEPLRVTVKFGDLVAGAHGGEKGTAVSTSVVSQTSATLTNPKLHCEYRTLTREMTDMTVESNYSQPLTQYAYDFVDETPKDFTPTAGSEVKIPITDNGCATDIYVYVEKPIDKMRDTGVAANVDLDIAERGIPVDMLDSVKLVCSGQTICELSPEVMDLFTYKSAHGGNYYGGETKGISAGNIGSFSKTHFVMRIPLSIVNDSASANTGALSLRELGNPEIVIKAKTTSTLEHRAHVMLRVQRLVSTDPSSGRMVVSVQS